MNEKASELGCTETSFSNPNGLDSDDHYSSAYDLALIADEAMKDPVFRNVVSTKSIMINKRVYSNHNKMLWQYSGTTGIKTGYTMSAGRTLVSCVEKNGAQFICVTLSDANDWEDHKALFDWASDNYTVCSLNPCVNSYPIPVITGASDTVFASVEDTVYILLNTCDDITITEGLKKMAYAPVIRGTRAGMLRAYVNGKLKIRILLVFTETIELYRE